MFECHVCLFSAMLFIALGLKVSKESCKWRWRALTHTYDSDRAMHLKPVPRGKKIKIKKQKATARDKRQQYPGSYQASGQECDQSCSVCSEIISIQPLLCPWPQTALHISISL